MLADQGYERQVESSRVESSLQYILLSSQELNYGLLVAPILYSQMCARALALAELSRALALADTLRAVRLDACNACTDPSCCWRPNSGAYSLNYYRTCLQRHEIADSLSLGVKV
jgi:hypothetical protein